MGPSGRVLLLILRLLFQLASGSRINLCKGARPQEGRDFLGGGQALDDHWDLIAIADIKERKV
jgi:hypothetical protein